MRLTLGVLLCVLATGCGTVCDAAVAAERGANQKAVNCSVQNLTVHDANKCNAGLQKCSSDDLQEINSYVSCLNNLPACSASNQIQFKSQRDGCELQAAFRISASCFNSIL